MPEKKEGFGPAPQAERKPPAIVFETPNYAVVVIRLSKGPADQAEELRVRYVVTSKRHPVIAAHSGLEGEAILLCIAAESALATANEEAEAAKARRYTQPNKSRQAGGLNIPQEC